MTSFRQCKQERPDARSKLWALAARAIYWYQVLYTAYTNRYQYTAHAASAYIVERVSGELVYVCDAAF